MPTPFKCGPQFILNELIKRLPGTVITHDVGACKLCAKPTESGMYLFCVPCLRSLSKGLDAALNHISEYNSLSLEFDPDGRK